MTTELALTEEPLQFRTISTTQRDRMLTEASPATEQILAEILSVDIKYHWAQDAICSQIDPEVFFPGVGESAQPALSICAQCPVQAECLDAALEEESQGGYGRYGVRGGLTARERSRLQAGQPGRPRKVAA